MEIYRSIGLDLNPSLSIEELIGRGQYNNGDPNVTTNNFPDEHIEAGRLTVSLAFFDFAIGKDEVIDEINNCGMQPSNIKTLLHFGAEVHEIQRRVPILALGSIISGSGGHRRVPLLYGNTMKRNLGLHTPKVAWPEGWTFLVENKTCTKST